MRTPIVALAGVVTTGLALFVGKEASGGDCAADVDLGSCCPNMQSIICWDESHCSPNIITEDHKYDVSLEEDEGFHWETPTDTTPALCDAYLYGCNPEPQTGCYLHSHVYRLCQSRRLKTEGAEACPP